MSAPDYSFESLVPGDVIVLGSISELTKLEDVTAVAINEQVAQAMHAEHVLSTAQWAARPVIADLIRPPKFYGNIVGIEVEVMADAYTRLHDASERGFGFTLLGGKPGSGLDNEFAEFLKPLYRGYSLTATGRSSSPEHSGQLQAELWYAPANLKRDERRGGIVQVSRDKIGTTVHRFVARKPKLEKANPRVRGDDKNVIAFADLTHDFDHRLLEAK